MSQLLRQLEAGTLSLAELAVEFGRRDWSIPTWSDDVENWGAEEPLRANDWRDVEAVRRSGAITLDQYEALKTARGPMVTRIEPT